MEPDRGGVLTDLARWLEGALGHAPGDLASYQRALTHGSADSKTYERLEFLGDRVLGLTVAERLYADFADESEGQLSKRLNAIVTGAVCAEVGREIGVSAHLKLGKQARDDGAADSDNVLGDVVEALIGALYLDAGQEAARSFILRHWSDRLSRDLNAPQHPKSELQEWAAANNRKPPVYEVMDRAGPGHAPRFTVRVTIGKTLAASAEGGSKHQAETAAAAVLLGQVRS